MRNKKNFTILGASILNLALSGFAISKLSNNVPLNFFSTNVIEKMVSKGMLFILPAIVVAISIIQVIYRLNTMDKPVTTGKLIEDSLFSFIDGLLIIVNWIFIYIGLNYTNTNLVNNNVILPVYVVTAVIGVAMIALYSTFPINKKGSVLGLRTKETMENDDVWRVANRFNGFTGFVSAILVILTSGYFMINGFNWIYLLIVALVCGLLMFYIPRLYAQMMYRKIVKKEE